MRYNIQNDSTIATYARKTGKKEIRMADATVKKAFDSVIGFAHGIFSPGGTKAAQADESVPDVTAEPYTDPRAVIRMESNSDGSVTVYHPDGSSERRAVIR